MYIRMFAWLLIPLIFCLSPWLGFAENLRELSETLHGQCLNFVSFKSRYRDIYEALLCGERLPAGRLKSVFVRGGLIHLMVVSGAHLLFLESAYKKIPLPARIKTPSLALILIVYALAARLYPPIMRALFAFFLFRLSEALKLFWSGGMRLHISGILCLFHQPAWIDSASLQLSWLASLAQQRATSLRRAFAAYLFILPIINRWQILPPLTVIINWLLAPVIGSLLFPLSFAAAVFPPLRAVCDWLWGALFWLLQRLEKLPAAAPLQKWSLPAEWTWPYLALIFLLVYISESYKRKQVFGGGAGWLSGRQS